MLAYYILLSSTRAEWDKITVREAVEGGPKVVTMGTLRWYAERDSPRRYNLFFSTRRKATDTPDKTVSEVGMCLFG
jgi:hypothetical protein